MAERLGRIASYRDPASLEGEIALNIRLAAAKRNSSAPANPEVPAVVATTMQRADTADRARRASEIK